jgi:hypothetical protein
MNTLHGGYTGELMVRWLGGASVAAALFLAVLFSIAFLRQALVESIWSEWQYFWTWEPVMYTFYYPLALWLVACLFAVVRFLGYLDLRIRREGWEVELLLRAEGARLTRQLT